MRVRPVYLLLWTVVAFSAFAGPAIQPRDGFADVNGLRLHYVDWGGRGAPLLLLTGFGNHAHIFDAFAPRFTDSFRVLGLTRRGFGRSARPASGYDVATRVEDIRKFLDAMKIDGVHLAGHSMAGEELTLFATKYPQRVLKLVYLDAAFDRQGMNAVMLTDPALTPEWKKLILEARGSSEAGKIGVDRPPPADEWRVRVATFRAMDAVHTSYRAVRAPALAFYAGPEKNHPMSWRESSLERRKTLNAWWTKNMVARHRASVEQFRREMRNGEVVILPDAHHFVFRGKTEEQVVAKMRAFLLR